MTELPHITDKWKKYLLDSNNKVLNFKTTKKELSSKSRNDIVNQYLELYEVSREIIVLLSLATNLLELMKVDEKNMLKEIYALRATQNKFVV